MGIILTGKTEELATRRATEAGFRDAADYIAHLVEADARDATDEALEGLLMEGLDSLDEPVDLEAMRAEGRALLQSLRQGR